MIWASRSTSDGAASMPDGGRSACRGANRWSSVVAAAESRDVRIKTEENGFEVIKSVRRSMWSCFRDCSVCSAHVVRDVLGSYL